MPRVYTTTPGDVRQIGLYGQASNDVPAEVPEDVAAELAGAKLFRVEVGNVHHTVGADDDESTKTAKTRPPRKADKEGR